MDPAKIKTFVIYTVLAVLLFVALLFFYKWYTKPMLSSYCGEFNNYHCAVGKCDYTVNYSTGEVGYCRKTLLGL